MKETNYLISENNKGEIFRIEILYNHTINCLGENLIKIISIPNTVINLYCYDNKLTSLNNILPQNIERLSCEHNNIKQLPDLRELKKLEKVWCDICCFEPYMLEMKNVRFELFC